MPGEPNFDGNASMPLRDGQDRPAGFGLPVVVDDRLAEALGDPARGRLVERLAGEEQRRSDDRSYFFRKAGSCFFSTRIAVGAENIVVTLYFSTRLHQMPPSGRIGMPSYMIVAMPAISGP